MNISQKVLKGSCVSCGMCSSICPRNAITMEYKRTNGFFSPIISVDKCIDCGLCLKCCPTECMDSKSVMGACLNIYLAHAVDEEIRKKATSGGVINTLIQFILSKNIVEAVLLVGHDANSPIEASAYIVTKDTVSLLAEQPREYTSRYVVVPVMERYKELTGKYKRIAVVGTPCQINSLQRVKKAGMKILSIGVTCSSGTSYLATQEYKHLMKATDSVMYYRGNGWPGYNSLYMGEEAIEKYHTGSLFERMFSSQIFKNPGCRRCSDHFAENADISFCDFWNAEEMSNEKIGNSCVIVRSKCGKQIFDDMISEGVVSVVRELEKKEVIKSQYGVLKAKKGNLKKKSSYTLFIWMIDIVRKTKVFRLFGLREYQKIAATYSKLCNKSSLDFKDNYTA